MHIKHIIEICCRVMTSTFTTHQCLQWYLSISRHPGRNHQYLRWFMLVKTIEFYRCIFTRTKCKLQWIHNNWHPKSHTYSIIKCFYNELCSHQTHRKICMQKRCSYHRYNVLISHRALWNAICHCKYADSVNVTIKVNVIFKIGIIFWILLQSGDGGVRQSSVYSEMWTRLDAATAWLSSARGYPARAHKSWQTKRWSSQGHA